MTSGRSVIPWTSGIAWRISSTSSASGSPTFTSSMSASGTCCATSTSMRDRSPACSSAWNFFRPVGLMRSPMTQNGRAGPITIVLDDDSRIVSNRLPFVAGGAVEAAAEVRDPRLLPEADQVQSPDAGKRPRARGELARELEALVFRVGRALAPLDQLGGHRDAGHLLVDEAQRGRRSDEADRRQDRSALGKAFLDRLGHEPLERREIEQELQLQEPGARADFLEGSVDAIVDRRRGGVLDRADEERRRRVELAAREVAAVAHRLGGRNQLNRVEVEDAPRLRLVTGGDVVPGQAADVLDPVQRGARDVGLQREPVAVATDQLHDRLHVELLQGDRDRER